VSISQHRTIIPAPADPARWPKPHVNTESPRMATFTGVIHYDPQRRRSLTAVTGWRSAWASDGLNTPGQKASRYDLYDEIGDDELEARWIQALPGERLHRRFAYGICGVSPVTGWWAVLYKQRQQVDALLGHGSDARAAEVLAWPALAIGLDQAGVEKLWPALGLREGSAPDERRWLNDPPLYTPTALVHQMLAAGVAPITMMTSNLELIDRRAVTFDGVPWFGFHCESSTGEIIVVEVSASGHARPIGPLHQSIDQVVARSWGAPSSAVRLRLHGTRLPACFDRLEERVDVLTSALMDGARDLRVVRLPASAVEALVGSSSAYAGFLPSGESKMLVAEAARHAGDVSQRAGALADRLLAKPVNTRHVAPPPQIRDEPVVELRSARMSSDQDWILE